MSQQTRILIGLAVLFGGLLFLARRYYTTRSHQNAEVVITETTDFVESALSSTSYTVSPTSETIPSIIKQVQLSVVEQGRGLQAISQLGPTGVDDLGEVFAERLRFLTVPDLERDYRASASRGDPLSKEEWFDRYRSYQQSVLDRRAIPAMNPTGVKVSVLSLGMDGQDSEKSDRLAKGFGVTIGKRGDKLPIPENPVRAGLTVVEVVLPMMSMNMVSREMETAILGYRFAWNTRANKWMPYESVIYKRPMSAFAPPRL